MSNYSRRMVLAAGTTVVASAVAAAVAATAVISLSLSASSRRRRLIRKAQRRPELERLRSLDMQLLLSLERQLDALHPCIGYYHRPRVHTWALNQSRCPAQEFKINFRVRQRDFSRMATALDLPDYIVTENRCRFTGEEALLIFLRRMSETGRDSTVSHYVGRERSEISRVFKHMSCWLVRAWWGTLRFDPVRNSLRRLKFFARVLRSRGSPVENVVGFLDGTRIGVCNPANKKEQEAVHNRKYGTNLAYQMVVGVDGLSLDFFGPIYGARHDSYIYARSKLEKVLAMLVDAGLIVYSDSAYGRGPLVFPSYRDTGDVIKSLLSAIMSGDRVTVEWAFGGLGNRFPLVIDKKKNKLNKCAVAAQFAAAVIINNAINCLEPSQTSQYFGVPPPSIEEFLHDQLPSGPEDYVDATGACIASQTDFALYISVEQYLADVEARVPQGEPQSTI